LNIWGYEEVFSFSQNRLSYLLATSMSTNCKLSIDSELPKSAVQRQLLFVPSQSSNNGNGWSLKLALQTSLNIP